MANSDTSSDEPPYTLKILRLHRTSCSVGATVGKVINPPETAPSNLFL